MTADQYSKTEMGNELILRLDEGIAAIYINKKGQAKFSIPENAVYYSGKIEDLQFNATLEDGSALPEWLDFNAGNKTFQGIIPENEETDFLDIRVVVFDKHGKEVTIVFKVFIEKDAGQHGFIPAETSKNIAGNGEYESIPPGKASLAAQFKQHQLNSTQVQSAEFIKRISTTTSHQTREAILNEAGGSSENKSVQKSA